MPVINQYKPGVLRIVVLGYLFSTGLSTPAWGQNLSCPQPPMPPRPAAATDRASQSALIDFRVLDSQDEHVSVFHQGVSLTRADQKLTADTIEVHHQDEQVKVPGPLRYLDHSLLLDAASAEFALDQDRAELYDVSYRLYEGEARGRAEQVSTADQRTDLEQVSFTTCPQGNEAWVLRAKRMTLDHERGRMQARGVALRFKDIPLFYLPYASFPLDNRRKSGFLYPGIGHSDDEGLDLEIPYYWNIAPNQDATFTPRWIEERGVMMQGEYRYLTQRSAGEFRFSYLSDDDLIDTHRALTELRSQTRLSPSWHLNIDLNHISDDRYFEDFGTSLVANSRSYLRSVAELTTQGDWWQAYLLADAYESIDDRISDSAEPYRRLPRLGFSASRAIGSRGLHIDVDAELVHFDHKTLASGSRADIYPRLSWPVYRSAGYLVPQLGLRHTSYDLDNGASDDSPSRTTGIASLEGGLIFERERSGGGLQTLEPRLHYLYVPFERQGDLPVFDTRDFTFGLSQLFRTNRFSGPDRQADANQASLALTSRLYSSAGQEVLDASIGTIFFFRDQRVQLPGVDQQDDDTSPLVAELNYRPSAHWRFSAGFQYDFEDDNADQGLMGIQYRGGGDTLFNLSYRKRSGSVRQADLSFLWPVAERWQVIGRANYSFRDDTLLEGLLGFEYQSCCWAVRLFGRRFVHSLEGEQRDGLYFELELKGLGSLGRDTGRVLERAVLGYREDDYD